MSKPSIPAFVGGLTHEEWKEAEQWAKRSGLIVDKTATPSHDWLLPGIASFLMKSGMIASPRLLEGRSQMKQYRQKLPEVLAFLHQIEKQLSRDARYRRQLAYLAARALAELEQSRGYFSVGAMLSSIDKIPEAINMAFPGYIQNNLLHRVVTDVAAPR